MRILRGQNQPNRKNNNMDFKKIVKTWLEKLITATETNAEKIKSHFHRVEGTTARAKGHIANIMLDTGKPVAAKEGHVHQYSGTISSDGEPHYVEGVTGPAIITGKDHYHKIAGRTTKGGNHSHKFKIDSSGTMRNKTQLRRKSVYEIPSQSLPRAVKEETEQ
jgi:hypothetical protein